MNVRVRPTAARALGLAVLLISVSGCATKGDLRVVTNELRVLAERQDSLLVALERQALITQDSLRGAADQLFEIRGSFNQLLRQIVDDLNTLQQLTGQNQRTLAQLREQVERIEQTQRRGGVAVGVPGVQTPLPGGSEGAVQLYNAGVGAFNQNAFTTARMAFGEVIERFPDDELAPEAQYKLAEMLVAENRMQEAIESFERIPTFYPTAGRVPDALYQIGRIYLEQGRPADARTYFRRVVETYGDSPFAEQAAARLREIGPGR